MNRFRRHARRGASHPITGARIERLESRTCLSASPPSAWQVDWNGRAVEAVRDTWILRTTSAAEAAHPPLAAGWRSAPLGEGFFTVTAPGASVADVLGWAGRTAGVATVEPDFLIAPSAVPNDPSFGQLWGLNNTGQSGGVADADVDAPEAWQTTTGSRNVVVAVIDTGVDYKHPDLAANIWTNPREIGGDGIDNDGNGFIDDVRGWDFANDDADPMDDDGHGTHVAGTIGAVGNNGTGVTGVNWQVSIMPLKFLGPDGGSTSDAIRAVNYATRMRRDFGVNVVASNNSWGGGGFSAALSDAIEAGGRAGILFVVAAGNDGTNNDTSPQYPANYAGDTVISVAALDRTNRLASFSNVGATTVDLAAPGVSIFSTLPGGRYGSYSGTSMATPHVTGTITLLAAANPQATPGQLRAAVLSSTTPLATLTGKVATGGALNAAAALAAIGSGTIVDPPPPPPPPPAPVDAGDTIRTAAVVSLTGGAARVAGRIGDGSAGTRDVDIYRVTIAARQRLVVDVDARSLAVASALDSYLRVFDSSGRQLASNDDSGVSLDSYLTFTARSAGTYYVGVSGFGNASYSATRAASGRTGSTGSYELALRVESTVAARSLVIRALGMPDVAAAAVAALGNEPAVAVTKRGGRR